MGSEQQQYIQQQEQKMRDQEQQKLPTQQTLEVVELERQKAQLPGWQQWIINILAVIGGLAIIYVVLDKLLGF